MREAHPFSPISLFPSEATTQSKQPAVKKTFRTCFIKPSSTQRATTGHGARQSTCTHPPRRTKASTSRVNRHRSSSHRIHQQQRRHHSLLHQLAENAGLTQEVATSCSDIITPASATSRNRWQATHRSLYLFSFPPSLQQRETRSIAPALLRSRSLLLSPARRPDRGRSETTGDNR